MGKATTHLSKTKIPTSPDMIKLVPRSSSSFRQMTQTAHPPQPPATVNLAPTKNSSSLVIRSGRNCFRITHFLLLRRTEHLAAQGAFYIRKLSDDPQPRRRVPRPGQPSNQAADTASPYQVRKTMGFHDPTVSARRAVKGSSDIGA